MEPMNTDHPSMQHRRPRGPRRPGNPRQRGAAAILAMMFLVIFSALAAAMAIVSEGNLIVADSNLRVSRSLAAAETGVQYMTYRINLAANQITTKKGYIDATTAQTLWANFRDELQDQFDGQSHNLAEPSLVDGVLTIGPVATGPNSPSFTATLEPHPIAGEDYNSVYYQRPPYNDVKYFSPVISNTNKLDERWVRLRVQATDKSQSAPITRSIQMDFKIEKKIKYAVLSKSRVMIGRNVLIEGPIGSRFTETDLQHGHPVQMESDFIGLDPDTSADGLDAQLQVFRNTLGVNDRNGDNRIDITNAAETDSIINPAQYDANGDGFIDDYDFFLKKFDDNGDKAISSTELETSTSLTRQQLLELIDTFGNPNREGYGDGIIDNKDQYTKIRGEILITANLQGWLDGAANGQYQDYLQGPITPSYQQNPLTFGAAENEVAQFGPEDFDVSYFKDKTDPAITAGVKSLAQQATESIENADPNATTQPQITQTDAPEAVPYGSAHPYDYYNRPVYKNMTFCDVQIPKGTNALFENCTFIGVTFVDTETNNTDEFYNYNGMMDENGNYIHRDKNVSVVDPITGVTTEVSGNDPNFSTKNLSNNIRFESCKFEGAVVSNAPTAYTQVRNKINFTGNTQFADMTSQAETPHLSASERELYRRSTILAPHMSVEMGTFVGAVDANEKINLSGTIVAGIVDMRGDIKINGTLLTTFLPVSDTGPVIGDSSPHFNTTLGYFASAEGDLEAERPDIGLGKIRIRYDPTLPLPDGITAPISLTPMRATYFEGGAN